MRLKKSLEQIQKLRSKDKSIKDKREMIHQQQQIAEQTKSFDTVIEVTFDNAPAAQKHDKESILSETMRTFDSRQSKKAKSEKKTGKGAPKEVTKE